MTRYVFAAAAALVACGAPDLEPPRPRSEPPLVVSLQPDAAPDAVPEVVRIAIAGGSERAREGRWALFSGELSSYHIGRIRRGDYPATLLERQVATETWNDDLGRVLLAPHRVLELGQTYSLASELSGLAFVFVVRAEPAVLFRRFWPAVPREGVSAGGGLMVYCLPDGSAPLPSLAPTSISLGPSGTLGSVAPGIDVGEVWADRCFHVVPAVVPPEGSVLLPPPELFGCAVDPAPVLASAAGSRIPLDCGPGEVVFGPGCATVRDDRVVVRSPGHALLWVDRSGLAPSALASRPDASFVMRGLMPRTRTLVSGVAYDEPGLAVPYEVELETSAAEPHLVLNEVLANPIGPEPGQEWVEIVNDSALAVELGGISFEDVGGGSALPAVALEPFEYALLVGADFDQALGFDVPPRPAIRLLRLDPLGKNGLANGGEPLRLRDAAGRILSTFPALSSPTAGTSLARGSPEALDTDPKSFGLHAAPGASPGGGNVLVPR